MKQQDSHVPHPIRIKVINRILIVVVVLLAIFSGYFHARYNNELGRYRRLEKKYFQLEQRYDKVLENETESREFTE